MNKIETLLKELCPNGITYGELNDVCEIIRGVRVTKKDLLPSGYPVVSGGTGYMGFIDKYNREPGTITIAQYGSAGYVNYQKERFWANDVCFSVYPNEKVLNKFLYHFLLNKQNYLYEISNRSAIPYSISKERILKIKIPIPPLEVQEEIVKILDKFTDYVTELTTELTLRQKQFEKYKEVLIGFEDKDIKLVKLLEIAEYGKKRIDNSEIEEGNYIGVENLLKNKEGIELKKIKLPSGTSIAFFPENILIGNIRPYLKKIYYSDFVGGTNGDVLVIQINEEKKHEVNPRFLYYCLSTDYFFHYMNQNSKGAKMPRGDKSKVMLFEFPLPSINKQSEIVAILDKFYNLTYNVSSGLPKEIELRKKQYEYYRDKLLSFD